MSLIEYVVKERVGQLILNRPEKRNALSPELIQELKRTLSKAAEDPLVKVVVLKAKGEAFCAGADLAYLKQLQSNTYEENLEDSRRLRELFVMMYEFPKVIIAQVEGPALAGGCGLVTVCDFCFATEKAKFGYTEVKIGFVPALVMPFLVRKLGEARARYLLLTGSQITSKEAYDMGLVNCVSHARAIEFDVSQLAQYLVRSNSSHSMMLTKQMLGLANHYNLPDALAFGMELNAKARESEDCKHGIDAFLNKKKITW
jgi:methylglutaconyl-CoA hydratase